MRVIVQGRLKQRSYETREGEKRTVFEVDVDEVGPSLRSATAKVAKVQRGSGGGGGGYSGGQSGGQPGGQSGGQSGGTDPWAAGGTAAAGSGAASADPWATGGGASDDPPF
jgi:single-strand DNA-binding protein